MQTKFLGSAGRFRDRFERAAHGVRRWADDRRGAIAIQFAFLAVPMSVMAFGLLDLNRMNTQKHNLQDALDAAALYAARSEADTNAELQVEGEKALNANLDMMEGAQLVSSSFELDGVTVIAKAEMKLPAVVSRRARRVPGSSLALTSIRTGCVPVPWFLETATQVASWGTESAQSHPAPAITSTDLDPVPGPKAWSAGAGPNAHAGVAV